MPQRQVWKSYCHKKDDAKITLTVLVQLKKLIALVQVKKIWEELNTGTNSKHLINTKLLIAEY